MNKKIILSLMFLLPFLVLNVFAVGEQTAGNCDEWDFGHPASIFCEDFTDEVFNFRDNFTISNTSGKLSHKSDGLYFETSTDEIFTNKLFAGENLTIMANCSHSSGSPSEYVPVMGKYGEAGFLGVYYVSPTRIDVHFDTDNGGIGSTNSIGTYTTNLFTVSTIVINNSGDYDEGATTRRGVKMNDSSGTFTRYGATKTTEWSNDIGIDKFVNTVALKCSWFKAYRGTVEPLITAEPLVTNSSWNVTSNNIVKGENSTVWNVGGTVNITTNLLSVGVTTNVNSNMSCRLDVDQNFTTMIATDSNYQSLTTDTTSHSMTITENITEGNHCLYCAFINGDGVESSNAQSGCLNFTLDRIQTSMVHADIPISGFTFDSATPITVLNSTINFTAKRNIIVYGSLEASKSNVPASTDLSMIIKFNNNVLMNKKIRTISSTGDFGSIALPFLNSTSVKGENNLSIEVYESGLGGITIDPFDIHILTNLSVTGGTNILSIIEDETSVSGTTIQNITTINPFKYFPSSSFFDISHTLTSLNDDSIGCRVGNGNNSPFWGRYINAGTTGSSGLSYFDYSISNNNDPYYIQCRTLNGNTINGNISILYSSDYDSNEARTKFSQNSNPLTDETLNITFNAGTHTIVEVNHTNLNGSSLEIIGTAIIRSDTGTQIPQITVSGNATICESVTHQRTLDNNIDIGTIKIYISCDSVDVGKTYNSKIQLLVAGGETVELIDESITVYETSNLDISTANLPPIVFITSPSNNAMLINNNTINWSSSDDSSDLTHNLTISNSSDTYRLLNNSPLNYFNFNFSKLAVGKYNITVIAYENDTPELLFSSDFVTITVYDIPIFSVNVNLSTPLNNSVVNTATQSFSYIVSNETNCSLVLNSVNVSTPQLSTLGLNSISYNGLINGSTYNWTIDCTGGNIPTPYIFSVNIPSSDLYFSTSKCPSTGVEIVLYILLLLILIFAGTLGWFFNVKILTSFSAFTFMFMSLMLVPCLGVLGAVFVAMSFVIFATLTFIGFNSE